MFKYITAGMFAALLAFTSCTDDLNTVPLDDDEVTSASVYEDPESYRLVMAKLYAGLAVSGQEGPAGQPDISGIDEGFSQYLRQYWLAQQLTTDESVIAWNDGNLRDYSELDWAPTNEFVSAMYNRIYYQISLTNEFIRETTEGKLNDRGADDALKAEVAEYRAEARFLRALSYWHALDLFGPGLPFVTEEDAVGSFFPDPISKADLFAYIESELLDIEDEMVAPRQNEYGRADLAAVWTLLAKLYLNAEVYIGQEKYTECIEQCEKVIAAGYTLEPDYQNLFLADNHTASGIIFPITFDGIHTKTYGGMTFVVHAAVGGSMPPSQFGIDGGWGGTRVTSAFVDQFSDITGNSDSRAMFYIAGQEKEIENIFIFTDGYAITKFKNVDRNGNPGSDLTFVDTDFPMFRLADVYLMYAEAVLRGGTGGDAGLALGYINELRERAYGDTSGNITQGEMTLDFILDERSRELYSECHRRTDLVRYGLLTSSDYLWPWKGGVQGGVGVNERYNLLPIPASDLGANPKLDPTPGYGG